MCGALSASVTNPGICLERTPAPPATVSNCGDNTVTFNWTINYNTQCSSSYTFELLDSSMTPFFAQQYPCPTPSTGVITDSFVWPVDQNIPSGCYYGRVTFSSNWCNGSSCEIEDQALVSVIISEGAVLTLCKFLDVNGNHEYDEDESNPGSMEPEIPGWAFVIERPLGNPVIGPVYTDSSGCVSVCLPVLPSGASSTTYYVREIIPADQGWVQTAPYNPVTQQTINPVQIVVSPGQAVNLLFGNWQPITITGYKLLDQAPWPWISPHYVGPHGQENPVGYEPIPILQNPPVPNGCASPMQPNQEGISGVTISLYNGNGTQLVGSTTTNGSGEFFFGPLQWNTNFILVEEDCPDCPPSCDPCLPGMVSWPGCFVNTAATSPWAPGSPIFPPNADIMEIELPVPVIGNQIFGCNYFWNNHPSRVWGQFCPDITQSIELENLVINISKDGLPWPGGPANVNANLLYEMPVLPEEPEGLRPGIYSLTLPQAPKDCRWQVTQYCVDGEDQKVTTLPVGVNTIDIEVEAGQDLRVDFCLSCNVNERQCFMPVTFTQEGWHRFTDPNNGIIDNGMVYNKFPIAFKNSTFYGTALSNKLMVGKKGGYTITFDGTTSGLTRLGIFLPQTGPCGKLITSYVNPWSSTSAGALAGEVVALTMNVAYNDNRLMPRTPGYSLENFIIRKGLLKGKTVRVVLDIANRVLGGDAPGAYGLPDCAALVSILQSINSNYEFIDFNTFTDRDYLTKVGDPLASELVHNLVVP